MLLYFSEYYDYVPQLKDGVATMGLPPLCVCVLNGFTCDIPTYRSVLREGIATG
jgi:hypothetical protein